MLVQVISLSCIPAASAPSSCKLIVYCHDMGVFTCSAAQLQGNVSLVPLPAEIGPNDPLSRTDKEVISFKSTDGHIKRSSLVMTPLLYCRGSPDCHVVFTEAKIQNVDLGSDPDPKNSTQVSIMTPLLVQEPARSPTAEQGQRVQHFVSGTESAAQRLPETVTAASTHR